MMKKENYLTKQKGFITLLASFLLFLCLTSSAQEKKAQDAYVEYFKLPRETLFLHTNKTTYLSGEEIWFTAYTYDRKTHLSSKATTNIYIGVYNKKGDQIAKKLYLAKEGVAKGNIAIDSSFVTGEYYLKASTNWMKNFKEDDSYIQKIQIINPQKITEDLTKKINTKEYDVQFLPEGGHMVVGLKNVVGVKAIDDTGKGTRSKGVILNSKGAEVTRFETNFLGLTKFSYTPLEGESYTAKITLENSKQVEQQLPKTQDMGFVVEVNNLREKNAIITLSTNTKTWKQINDQEFRLFIHKDGEAKIIPIIFDTYQKRIVIEKSGLFKGINTVTLFNSQNQPIVERMFFNAEIQNNHLSLIHKEVLRDSLKYQLVTNLDSELVQASISVLPSQSISYHPKQNILSTFYLQPYVKGTIENPHYYFKNFDQKKQYELDILLITQGWSRYSWDNIFNFPPEPNFDFENGITINGHLNTPVSKVTSLMLYPSNLNPSTFVDFDENGKFTLKNFYPIRGESLGFSYIDKKGSTHKPSMALSFLGRMSEDRVATYNDQDLVSFYVDKNDIPNGFFGKDSELLDEIVIKAELEKKKRKEYRLPFRGKIYNVNRKLAQEYIDLSHFLNNHGFVVDNIGLNPTRLGTVNIRHNFARRGPVVIYLDGMQLRDFNPVADRMLDQFEDIYIDDTPNTNIVSVGGNVGTFVVVIKLFSRRTSLWNLDDRALQNITKVPFGFEETKKFYTPKYADYNIKPFKEYGVIHWEPNAQLHKNKAFTLKMLNTQLEEINVYIEGIASDGTLISQTIRLENSIKQK